MTTDRSRAFSPMVMLVLVLVGCVSLAGLGLLAAYEPELRSGDNGQGHALSRSAVGFAAVARLLEESGTPVVMRRGALSATAGEGLLVLTPALGTSPTRLSDIEHAGPVLVVLPKWVTIPHPARRSWVRAVGEAPDVAVLKVLPEPWRQGLTLQRRPGSASVRLARPDGRPVGVQPRIENLATLSGPGWIPVVVDDAGRGVLVMNQKTGVYVLADPDFLDTAGMKTLAGARAAIELLSVIRAQGVPVVFDLTLHGFERSLNPLRLMLEPPLLGATLCLLAALILVGVQAAVRFGPAQGQARAVALGKRALADNTAGLVRMARREHRMAAPYAEMVRAEAARAVGAPRGLEGDELDAVLDRLGAASGASHRISNLIERARAARTKADLMEVARDLYRWRLEMMRERR
ncbi:MAG: hypothetical protein C0481_06965 [Phenylobacterium sp.]|uniref:DUF4350 domain-containing protein n=1 Tax=Phenylobacterium sp. TaxID=1871053 RepID=UPI0025E82F93|nr:hypothetical protein [Phenylobacterium sp.]MBA4011591.1 hypothetical protein [Phenylobacterium sp.]